MFKLFDVLLEEKWIFLPIKIAVITLTIVIITIYSGFTFNRTLISTFDQQNENNRIDI